MTEQDSRPHYYGGQAVMEGVMMRGRKVMAVAVRNAKGEIVVYQEPLTAKIYTSPWGKLPFIRGLTLLWDALGLGTRALMWSAEVASQGEADMEAGDGIEKAEQGGSASGVEFSETAAWTTVAASMAFAIVFFFLLPTFASRLIASYVSENPLVDAMLEGLIRLVLFVLYLWGIGQIEEIQRVFGYHGAEHKAINAYEAKEKLEISKVQAHSIQHTRCGTSFLLYVLIISIILFAPLTFSGIEQVWLALILRFISRLLLVPVVAGIAYEIIRFSAAHDDKPLMKLLISPGLALQKLTTRPPDNQMIECAIAALKPVLAADGIEIEWEATSPMIMSGPLSVAAQYAE